ncbi:MAG: hypothetical protein NVSMB63_03390 [Sediminibacterium sp.]
MLLFQEDTLLKHSLQQAINTNANPVMLVLGAHASLIKKGLDKKKVLVVQNDQWEEGIGASIRTGIKAIEGMFPQISGAIIMVCDQPYITSSHLNNLIASHQHTGKPIIASKYETGMGTPVLFDRSFFPPLLDLQGETGAKKTLQQYPEAISYVSFPLGDMDIDTMEDYENLMKQQPPAQIQKKGG